MRTPDHCMSFILAKVAAVQAILRAKIAAREKAWVREKGSKVSADANALRAPCADAGAERPFYVNGGKVEHHMGK